MRLLMPLPELNNAAASQKPAAVVGARLGVPARGDHEGAFIYSGGPTAHDHSPS
jgi:hypothetical protein